MTFHAPHLDDSRPVIAIIGGGVSGAALAYQLARRDADARIVVFEPRARLGTGLAYDTTEPTNRINVPADRMSLNPGDDGHFTRWIESGNRLADDPEARTQDGRLFPRRSLFGTYVVAHIDPYIGEGKIEHHRARVTAIYRDGDVWRVEADGSTVNATHVVIATTHPPPTPPREIAGIAGDHRVVLDPLKPGWADDISPDERILIIGTGLTMADTVAALDRRGHRGSIVAISRRGLRSRAHPDTPSQPFGDFATVPAKTALELLKRIRAEVALAVAQGLTWHPVLDAVRTQAQSVWAHLPEAERSRLVRKLRPYWDVHRFRIAPAVNAVLDRRIAEATLTIRAARLQSVIADETGLNVSTRSPKTLMIQTETIGRMIITTGPGHRDILTHQTALKGLHDAGQLCLDRVGLGLACDRRAQAIGRDGQPVAGLYIAGPLARGTFGELMGLPQVSEFAVFLSNILLESLAHYDRGGRQAHRPSVAERAR